MKLWVFVGMAVLTLAPVLQGQSAITQLAPTSVANAVYSSSTSASSTLSTSTIFLNADGTWESLWSFSRVSALPGRYFATDATGKYSYAVTGPASADLTFYSDTGMKVEKLKFNTNTTGSIETLLSVGTSFTLWPANPHQSLIATSVRVRIAGGSIAIAGVAIAGSEPRFAMVRAVGPGLAKFGVSDVLPDPALAVFDSAGRKVGSGEGWTLSSLPQESLRRLMRIVGMYPLADDSKDAVLLCSLPPGPTTIQCSSVSNASGEVVIECYLLP